MVNSTETRIWGIHTRNDSLFLNDNVVAIVWSEVGNIGLLENNRDSFKEQFIVAFPNAKKGNIAITVGQLYRFVYEVKVDDYVVFPSKSNREINIGKIEGDYCYNPETFDYVNQRKVRWIKHLPRTAFSQGALYEIGSAMTLFSVKNYADEFLAALDKKKQEPFAGRGRRNSRCKR